MKQQDMDKKWIKEYQQIRANTIREIIKSKKNIGYQQQQEIVASKIMERQMEIIMGIVKEYEKNCPD